MWTTKTVRGPAAGPACPCTASVTRERMPSCSARGATRISTHDQHRLQHGHAAAQVPAAAVAACRQAARRAALDAHFAARVASHDSASTSQSWAPQAQPRQQPPQQRQQQQQRQQPAAGTDALLLPSRVLPRSHGGTWCLRQYEPRDFQQVVELQTTSFHEPLDLGPFAVLDVLARSSFNAEVLDALKKKVAALQPSLFAMLVVEEQGASGSCVVGVVEVGLQDLDEVLRWLPRNSNGDKPDCYAHVASMAVSKAHRRQGIASLLLEAAEQQAALWRQQVVALHVHADNAAAVQLYSRCGMRMLHSDPAWWTLVGGRVRLLMAKPVGAPAAHSQ